MYGLLLIIFTAVISPILVIVLTKSNAKRKSSRFPPGSHELLPIVGSTFSLMKSYSAITVGDFMEKQLSRYGRIFSITFLGRRIVVSADPELNRFVLNNEMKLFDNNVPTHMRRLQGETALAFLRGDAYRFKKSITLGFINTCRGLHTSFLELTELTAARFMDYFRKNDVVSMRNETSRYIFEIMMLITIGIGGDNRQMEQLRTDQIALHDGIVSVPLNLPKSSFSKALQARANISKFLKQKIEERKSDQNLHTDYVDFLTRNTSFGVEEISESIIIFIVAGLYTTSTILALAVFFLANCPKAVEQMREESLQLIRSKQKDEKLKWDDYKNLNFTQCVINETLRLGNVVPNLWKRTLEDFEFKGYLIPKGTTIMVHTRAMNLDPSTFEHPNNFYPWRWLSETGVKKFDSWMPFGGGIRYCSGREMARTEISVFLHHLVLRYDFELTESDSPVACPLVKFPKGLPMKVRARHYDP